MRVRAAGVSDLDRVASMAAELVRFHHGLDPDRFLVARGMERGYRGWLAGEMRKEGAMLVVAEDESELAGYAYARREARDWMKLVEEHVALIDLWVEPAARRRGAGDALVREILARAEAMGVRRVLLETAARNEAAQRLFAKHGFEPSMIEMMRRP